MQEKNSNIEGVQHNNIFDYLIINWPAKLQKLAFKHRYVKLDQQFLDYVLEDGIFIHEDYCRDKEIFKDMEEEDLEKFHKFSSQIEEDINKIIKEFGQVYYKLNWKAPLDCQSFAQNLKITHIEDLIKLIKSSQIQSDMIIDYKDLFEFDNKDQSLNKNDCNKNGDEQNSLQNQEVDQKKEQEKGLYLIFKKFYDNIDYKKEFRCFVYKNELRGICQKNTGDFYKEMKEIVSEIQPKIVNFFKQNVQNQFIIKNKDSENQNYVFDIYIENIEKPKIWIIDIDPWQEFTNPLLFSFNEIKEFGDKNQSEKDKIFFKYVDDINNTQIRDYSAYRVPEELADEDPSQENLIKLMEQMAKQDPKFFQ